MTRVTWKGLFSFWFYTENKIPKDVIEERLSAGYKNDVKVMLLDFQNSGLDTQSQRCEKCEYKSHSEGLLREHNLSKHKNKETKENIILGYEFDMQRHLRVL